VDTKFGEYMIGLARENKGSVTIWVLGPGFDSGIQIRRILLRGSSLGNWCSGALCKGVRIGCELGNARAVLCCAVLGWGSQGVPRGVCCRDGTYVGAVQLPDCVCNPPVGDFFAVGSPRGLVLID